MLNRQCADGRATEREDGLTPHAATISIVPLRRPPTAHAHALDPSCTQCRLRTICLPSGLPQDQLAPIDHLTRAKRKVVRGAALFRQGDRFESLYAIRSGSFKSMGIVSAQQRKVMGLHLPAELLALGAIGSEVHECDAIAVEDSEVCVVPYGQLTSLMLTVPELQTYILRALSADITRHGGLMLRLGAMTAEQRVLGFLLGLSARYQSLGYAGTRFNLRMTRHDIASYLGITVETTSRIFSRLERDGLIGARLKSVEIRDLNRLRELLGY